MAENLFEAQYDITKKSKFKRFYEANKILIFIAIFLFVVSLVSINFYFDAKEKKKMKLSENYVMAKLYLDNDEKIKATNILKEIIFADDRTYSTLSFFLILNQDLLSEHKEISDLFDHLLANNEFAEEEKNLIIYKKMLFESNVLNETELLEVAKPLLNTETIWKPHALMLLGDYFASKKEYLKAKEFYTQILTMPNLQKDFYDLAKFQLSNILND